VPIQGHLVHLLLSPFIFVDTTNKDDNLTLLQLNHYHRAVTLNFTLPNNSTIHLQLIHQLLYVTPELI
jgi:hypothetical protein